MNAKSRSGLLFEHDLLFLFDEPVSDSSRELSPNWIEISLAYKSAADQLLDKVMTDGRRKQPSLYPVLFLYRHFAELQIKSLLLLSYIGLSEDSRNLKVSKILSSHDLLPLLHEFLDLATFNEAINDPMRFLRGDIISREEAIDVVTGFLGVVTQLSDLDRSSYTFRYSVKKDLTPIPASMDGLSLKNLRDVASRLEQTCKWIRDIIEHHIDDTVNRDLSDSDLFDPFADR